MSKNAALNIALRRLAAQKPARETAIKASASLMDLPRDDAAIEANRAWWARVLAAHPRIAEAWNAHDFQRVARLSIAERVPYKNGQPFDAAEWERWGIPPAQLEALAEEVTSNAV